MGIVAVVVSLAVSVHARIRLRGSDAVLGIAFDGHCWQLIGNGWRKDARLLATVVWPFLVVLQFQTNDRRRYHLLVMRDAVAPSMFAQLRVAARLASLPG